MKNIFKSIRTFFLDILLHILAELFGLLFLILFLVTRIPVEDLRIMKNKRSLRKEEWFRPFYENARYDVIFESKEVRQILKQKNSVTRLKRNPEEREYLISLLRSGVEIKNIKEMES